jgi:hypothetical protein
MQTVVPARSLKETDWPVHQHFVVAPRLLDASFVTAGRRLKAPERRLLRRKGRPREAYCAVSTNTRMCTSGCIMRQTRRYASSSSAASSAFWDLGGGVASIAESPAQATMQSQRRR